MTDARVSQVAAEVIRTNLAPSAQLSQLAIEALVSNIGVGSGSSSGTSTASASAGTAAQGAGASNGTSTVSATSSTAIQSIAAADGSSLASSASLTIIQSVASSDGTSTVSAASPIIIQAVGESSGVATVSAIGVTARQAIGSSSGIATSSVLALGAVNCFGICSGTALAKAVGVAASLLTAVGTSTANAVGMFTHEALTQLGNGIACIDETTDANGQAGTSNDVASTQILGPINCAVLTGVYTPPKTGTLIKPNFCTVEKFTPVVPFDPVWTWQPTPMVAKCCDVTWSGNEIIIGTFNETALVPGGYIPSDGHVYVSRDRGLTWVQQPPQNANWRAVTITANSTLMGAYPAFSTTHYISNDSGAGWSSIVHPWGSTELIDAKVSDFGNLFMVGVSLTSCIYLSTQNGVTWTTSVPLSFPPNSYDAFSIGDMSSNGNVCYAGRYHPSFSVAHLDKSTDLGNSWKEVSGGCAWSDMSCSGDGRYVIASGSSFFGDGVFLFSKDSGGSFTKSTIWASKTAISTNGQVVAYADGAGGVKVSKDYGSTFSSINQIPNSVATDIAINADGSTIVVTFANDYVYIGRA